MKEPVAPPFELVCEAPRYALIQAMTWLDRPLDQRWRLQPSTGARCCGLELPMPTWRFTWSDESESVVSVGQCPVCKACHWHL